MDDSATRKKPTWLEIPQRPARVGTRPKGQVNPFADRASLLARTLCASPDRSWEVVELAKAAGVSPMVASGAVRQLESLQAVTVDRSGPALAIRLQSLEAMLTAWSAAYDWTHNRVRTFRAPPGDPLETVRHAAPAWGRHRWALTLQAGASLVARMAAWDTAHLYVDVESEGILQALGEEAGWTPDPRGQIVLMKPYYREALWEGTRILSGLPVVDTLQLVVDLWQFPVRGIQQAVHLIERGGLGDRRG